MKNKLFAILTLASISAVNTHVSTAFAQGNLTPPGPPGPTFKTLQEVEPRTPVTNLPYTISQPGSYYFVTNLTGASGITISASGVTVDLMGFELVGGTGNGILASGSRTNIAIRNGTVRGWTGGVSLGGVVDASVSDLHVAGNTTGIDCGQGARVRDCLVRENGTGITVGNASLVVNSVTVSNSRGVGISAGVGCKISGCIARDNGTSNSFAANIVVGDLCTVSDCTATYSPGVTARVGISAGSGCTISGCTVYGCRSGIIVQVNCTISGCTALSSLFDGISADARCSVRHCTANDNGRDGIAVSDWCQVIDNLCENNGINLSGGAGVHTTSFANRVEGNTCVANDFGILVDGTGSLIIRNCLRGNGNDSAIVAGNTTGPAVTSANIGGSSNPHANYIY